jgi:hypothetical protein
MQEGEACEDADLGRKERYTQLSQKDDAPTAIATAAEVDGADSEEAERRNHEPEAGLHLPRVKITAAISSMPP